MQIKDLTDRWLNNVSMHSDKDAVKAVEQPISKCPPLFSLRKFGPCKEIYD